MSLLSRLFGGGRKKPHGPPKSAVDSSPSPRPLTSGVYEFCGWASERVEFGKVPGEQCHTANLWDTIQTNDRKMLLGTDGRYDERDPEITKARVKMCDDAGVSFMVKQAEWSHAHTQPTNLPGWAKDFPGAPLIMAHCADNHAALDTSVKFCIDWWDVLADKEANHWTELKSMGWTGAQVIESWRWFIRTVAARYMSKSTYLTVDGRPVLFKGRAESMGFYRREFGVPPEVLVRVLREETLAATGRELYLVATATDESCWPSLKAWGFDALTHYALLGDGWAGAMGAYGHWWSKGLAFARQSGLHYLIPVSAGYDARAWPGSAQHVCIPTPAEFTAHVREARKLSLDNYDVTRGMSVIYALTEFGEGGVLEAMQRGQLHDGDSMLRAFKAAL